MSDKPLIGSAGGPQFDIANAIKTFLGTMAEGSPPLPPAIIKELLQNADDAGATELSVILDERKPPSDMGKRAGDYAKLADPALLVRNNAKFRTAGDPDSNGKDDFAAICTVAAGLKWEQATAAGRFGIGFNSVYFLTDTPAFFSRREIHVFDPLHAMFEGNGWRFPIDEFPAAEGNAGTLKWVLEWIFPASVLATNASVGDLAGNRKSDYTSTLFRLPFRRSEEGQRCMYVDRFHEYKHRLHCLESMMHEAATAVLFLRNLRVVRFGVLEDKQVMELGRVELSSPSSDFADFLKQIDHAAHSFELGPQLDCRFRRTIDIYRSTDNSGDSKQRLSYELYHRAAFDSEALLALRTRLHRNRERAVPWVTVAVPLDVATATFENEGCPSWRVFLPLLEDGPCSCVLSGGFFVGPTRQNLEHRSDDGPDEAMRKTLWNEALATDALLPVLVDATADLSDLVPEMITTAPDVYLRMFPSATTKQDPPLTALVKDAFLDESWVLKIPDMWGDQVELIVSQGPTDIILECIPKWLHRYKDTFRHLASDKRRFIGQELGNVLNRRLADGQSIVVRLRFEPDVAAAILNAPNAPEKDDLEKLLERLGETISPETLQGMWAFRSHPDGKPLRYDNKTTYLMALESEPSPIHQALQNLGLEFDCTQSVDGHRGLPSLPAHKKVAFTNLIQADDQGALELLLHVKSGNRHDRLTNSHLALPVIEFLCEQRHLPPDLNLGFLVSTASTKRDRRSRGCILLRPLKPNDDEKALWDAIFHTFAEVEPRFVDGLHRLLQRHHDAIDLLHETDCEFVQFSDRLAIQLLHEARLKDPSLIKTLAASMNRPSDAHQKAADRAANVLITAAEKQWPDLNDEQQATVLSLPLHRGANGEFVSLLSPGEDDPDLLPEHFWLQSDDDLEDAPIKLPTGRLLNPTTPSTVRFYRDVLELRPQSRETVLKEVLKQFSSEGADRPEFLTYLSAHYKETIKRLSRYANSDDLARRDVEELQMLFDAAPLVPCEDGKWHRPVDCTEAWEAAKALAKQQWSGREVRALLVGLAHPKPLARLNADEVRSTLQDLCAIETLDPRSLAKRAVTSESQELDLDTRVRLLADNWNDWPRDEVKRARCLDEMTTLAVGGEVPLSSLVRFDGKNIPARILEIFHPTSVDTSALSKKWNVNAKRLVDLLNALQVPDINVDDVDLAVEETLADIWPTLNEHDRLTVLRYIGNRPHLMHELKDRVVSLDVVLVGKGRWVGTADAVAPCLLATKPPYLREDQVTKLGEDEPLTRVWDAWCKVRTPVALLHVVVSAVQGDPKPKEAAKKLYTWLENLDLRDEDLREPLEQLAWVLARRGDEMAFQRPGAVLKHPASEILSLRYWVSALTIPTGLSQANFASQLDAQESTLQAIACCLEEAKNPTDRDLRRVYELVANLTDQRPRMLGAWKEHACSRAVYSLFRSPDRRVMATDLFLGTEAQNADFGTHLFCLGANTNLPDGVRNLYERLGVELEPSLEQLVVALSAMTEQPGNEPEDTYSRLVDALVGRGFPSTIDLDMSSVAVKTCAGTWRRLSDCLWHDDLGQPGLIETSSAERIIDTRHAPTKSLVSWVKEQTGEVRHLDDEGAPRLDEIPAKATLSDAASQILVPWRDWLAQFSTPTTNLHESMIKAGLASPEESMVLLPVERIPLVYDLEDGESVRPSGKWKGPSVHAVLDSSPPLLLVRKCDIERCLRDGYVDADGCRELDHAIAEHLVNGLGDGVDSPTALIDEILKSVERPSVVLARLRQSRQESLISLYEDQVADLMYAELFTTYQKTSKGASTKRKELREKMTAIIERDFVQKRRDQIAGYGYDEISVFAELIQNADDAYLQRAVLGMDPVPAPSVEFRFTNEPSLIVEHQGRPFNYSQHGARTEPRYAHDVEGVLRSAGSFKLVATNNTDAGIGPIGRFGLGFKSVFLLTARPIIHSGAWHFEIESGCIPKELPPPPDLAAETTRIELPLCVNAEPLMDKGGQNLVNLLPFLRHIEAVRWVIGDEEMVVAASVESAVSVDDVVVEKVVMRGVSEMRDGRLTFLRIRHKQHAGQLGLYVAPDGLPETWSSGFDSDVFVTLPLRTQLGVGVGLSHQFLIQSGRTHLVERDENQVRFEEAAALLAAVPAALRLLDATFNEAALRFWTMWRWNEGDNEVAGLKNQLATGLKKLALEAEIVPTLESTKSVALADAAVFWFSGLPRELQEAIMEAEVAFDHDGRIVALHPSRVIDSRPVLAIHKVFKHLGEEMPSTVQAITWTTLGETLPHSTWLADHPNLLNAIASSPNPAHLISVRTWLPHCRISGVAGDDTSVIDVPPNLLPFSFPGIEHLPLRRLKRINRTYDDKAVALLLESGLPNLPTSGTITAWLRDGMDTEECVSLLRYLAETWRQDDYKPLKALLRAPWFQNGPRKLTTGEAYSAGLIPENVLDTDEFRAWLGIQQPAVTQEVPEIPQAPPKPDLK